MQMQLQECTVEQIQQLQSEVDQIKQLEIHQESCREAQARKYPCSKKMLDKKITEKDFISMKKKNQKVQKQQQLGIDPYILNQQFTIIYLCQIVLMIQNFINFIKAVYQILYTNEQQLILNSPRQLDYPNNILSSQFLSSQLQEQDIKQQSPYQLCDYHNKQKIEKISQQSSIVNMKTTKSPRDRYKLGFKEVNIPDSPLDLQFKTNQFPQYSLKYSQQGSLINKLGNPFQEILCIQDKSPCIKFKRIVLVQYNCKRKPDTSRRVIKPDLRVSQKSKLPNIDNYDVDVDDIPKVPTHQYSKKEKDQKKPDSKSNSSQSHNKLCGMNNKINQKNKKIHKPQRINNQGDDSDNDEDDDKKRNNNKKIPKRITLEQINELIKIQRQIITKCRQQLSKTNKSMIQKYRQLQKHMNQLRQLQNQKQLYKQEDLFYPQNFAESNSFTINLEQFEKQPIYFIEQVNKQQEREDKILTFFKNYPKQLPSKKGKLNINDIRWSSFMTKGQVIYNLKQKVIYLLQQNKLSTQKQSFFEILSQKPLQIMGMYLKREQIIKKLESLIDIQKQVMTKQLFILLASIPLFRQVLRGLYLQNKENQNFRLEQNQSNKAKKVQQTFVQNAIKQNQVNHLNKITDKKQNKKNSKNLESYLKDILGLP